MGVGEALAAVGGLGVFVFGMWIAHKAPVCDHAMHEHIHAPTGRKFWSCHCGERFQRERP